MKSSPKQTDYPIYSEGKLSERKQLFHLSLRNRLPALRQTPISESDTDSQNDERQALKRIVVFFAVMLILTLVARGTSSAIRPVVTTQQAKAGTISQSVQSSGSITASSVLSVSLPEGIVLDNILVKEGQSVVEGQTLATCDVDELSTKLDRAKASLQKSKAEYNQLLSNAVLDDTSVARTQQALLRAYEADQKAYEELEKLRASENPDPEAISTAEQAADDAHWAAQQAEYDRNSALASYQEMQRQNNLSAQVNQASAEDVALDIKDTQAEIEQLEQLVNQQGVISSPFSGVISNVEAEVGTESTQTFCTIYDTSKGYLFACELPAAQASDCQTGLSAVIKQGDQTETAAITAISENAENDTVDITIQLTATDWKVGPADAEIVLSEQDYDLCLPNTAISAQRRHKTATRKNAVFSSVLWNERNFLMNQTKNGPWNSPLLRSQVTSEDVRPPEMLFGYLIGPFGALLASGIFTSQLQNYLTNVLKLDLGFLTTLQLLSTILIVAANLVVGQLIERTRTLAGKARPWILLSALTLQICSHIGQMGIDFASLRIIGLQIRDGSLHLIRTLNGQIQHTFLFAVHRFPAASDSVNLDTHLIQLISHGTRDVGADLQIIKLSLNLVDRALIQAQRNTNALGFCCSGDLLSNPLSLRLNTSFVQSYTNLDAAFGIDQLCNVGKLRRNTLCGSLFISLQLTGQYNFQIFVHISHHLFC